MDSIIAKPDPSFVDAVGTYLIFYLPLYSITALTKKRKIWESAAQTGSTVNALQCIYMVVTTLISLNRLEYYDLVYSGNDYVIKSLYWFAAYLFVDGIFHLPNILSTPNLHGFTSILHHFVGGLSIYMIAKRRMGLGFGLYFAGTEISTPLLNLSRVLYKVKNNVTYIVFGLFYCTFFTARIVTVPLLIRYIKFNRDVINRLEITDQIMIYGGSGILALLNIIWFIMLTRKVLKMLRSNKND